MVRSGVLVLGWLGGGGCGTSASNPLGVKGVITIKMISITSSTSINGVTLMSAFGPPLVPIAIDIFVLLYMFTARHQGAALYWPVQAGQEQLSAAQSAAPIDPLQPRARYLLRPR